MMLLPQPLAWCGVQANSQASREEAGAAKMAESAARQDLEAAREVISSLTNQLAITDQAAEQVGCLGLFTSPYPMHASIRR